MCEEIIEDEYAYLDARHYKIVRDHDFDQEINRLKSEGKNFEATIMSVLKKFDVDPKVENSPKFP